MAGGRASGGNGLKGAAGAPGAGASPVGRFAGAVPRLRSGSPATPPSGGGIGWWKTGAEAPGSTVRGGSGAAPLCEAFKGGIGGRVIEGGGGGGGTNACGGGGAGRGDGIGLGGAGTGGWGGGGGGGAPLRISSCSGLNIFSLISPIICRASGSWIPAESNPPRNCEGVTSPSRRYPTCFPTTPAISMCKPYCSLISMITCVVASALKVSRTSCGARRYASRACSWVIVFMAYVQRAPPGPLI